MDATSLAWGLRIEETEALLHRKQNELQAQLSRLHILQEHLRQREQAVVDLKVRLLKAQEKLAAARHGVLTSQQEADKRQAQLDQGAQPSCVPVQAKCVQDRLTRVRAALATERERMTKWRESLQQPDGCIGEVSVLKRSCAEMQARIDKIEAGLTQLREQLDCSGMIRKAAEFKEELQHVTQACATKQHGVITELTQQLAATELQVKQAQQKVSALQAWKRISHLKARVAAAHREQVLLQSQLDGLDAWRTNLKPQNA